MVLEAGCPEVFIRLLEVRGLRVEPAPLPSLINQEGQKLQQPVRRGNAGSVRYWRSMTQLAPAARARCRVRASADPARSCGCEKGYSWARSAAYPRRMRRPTVRRRPNTSTAGAMSSSAASNGPSSERAAHPM